MTIKETQESLDDDKVGQYYCVYYDNNDKNQAL